MNEARFQAFAEQYVLAVETACRNLGMYRRPQETIEKAALDTTLDMLGRIRAAGVEGVEHYVVNRVGGAFAAVCAALSIQNTSRALQDYLDGRDLAI